MKITHRIPKLALSNDKCDASSFILSNNLGGFVFFSNPILSKYNGIFYNKDLNLYKIIESIRLEGSKQVEVVNSLSKIEERYADNVAAIEYPQGVNGISYSLDKKASIIIDFDCRRINDLRSFGRYYDVKVNDDNIIVNFRKMTDPKEDGNPGLEEFVLSVAIYPRGCELKNDYEFTDRWEEVVYPYDKERQDSFNRFVYRPFVINAKGLLIGFGRTEHEAVDAISVLKKTKQRKKTYLSIDSGKQETDAAFVCAQDSLEKLMLKYDEKNRLYAGFPWFFQIWTRDENISLGAFMKLKEYKFVKDVLFSHIKSIDKDGRLPNYIPSPHLASSDGVGWYWKRMGDFLSVLKKEKLLKKYISANELDKVKDTLQGSITKIEASYLRDGLIVNGVNETWMDTVWNGQDGRPGARIEMQALHMNMLDLMYSLSGDKLYKSKKEKMRRKVLDVFWKNPLLRDGAGDNTIRPNIFLTCYIYPELLSKREWERCFMNANSRLWLDWGGMASIDKTNPLFTKDHSGIDNKSYHRGDSWYWVNNLAALCMYRNNPNSFKEKVEKIAEASSSEILWHGCVGHHAELSSASHLSSKGCFSQAWSSALLIELLMEIYEKKKV